MNMDRAMLDISPDDAVDMNNKKRILRWDAKKRKFVKQTLQEMAESQKKGVKRMRTESGIISKKSALPQVSNCSLCLNFSLSEFPCLMIY